MTENVVGLTFREATRADVPAIVAMLADDMLGRQRERLADPLPDSYYTAFDAIAADPNNVLLVVCRGHDVVGTLQLTLTPSLSHRGSLRGTIESVRTTSAVRGQGVGSALVRYAIEAARQRGCAMVQLSSDKRRGDAKRFYERLGFRASHEGMKLALDEQTRRTSDGD
jgi:ribosomal protein S18 acetylase RimI-like enzyme